ncbi:uncharacterized protein LOC116262860 [Nymphaea colorata]|uniref:S-adenosyl-L-methionine-dependent methyltransferase n=1 Tax=Nymphaea colorata TaxID=210225 RepID=A0A5K0WWB1_9MAGN|nr:uncharacterized protein LOC116262860 [Nymphaea colorata]
MMKEEKQRRYPPLASRLFRPVAYVLLLFLSYAFGFYSGIFVKPPINNSNTDVKNLTAERLSYSNSFFNSDHFRFGSGCANPIPSELIKQTVLAHIFNGTSPFIGFPPPHLQPLLQKRRIKGWGSNGDVFENLIRRVKPRTIIEIGTFLGASAIHMGQVTRKLGLSAQIFCVDDFRGWPEFNRKLRRMSYVNGDVLLLQQFMQNVNYMNMTEMITPIPFSSSSALVKLCEWGVVADLIEIDAGHDFHSAWSDINLAYKVLRPGGVIFGHDYFTMADDRGVRRAVNLFAKAKGLRVEVDGQHWVIDST